MGNNEFWALKFRKKFEGNNNYLQQLQYILSETTESFHTFRSGGLSGRIANCKIPNIIRHFIADKRQNTISSILNILTHIVMQYVYQSFLSN